MEDLIEQMKQYGLVPNTAIKQLWITEPGEAKRYSSMIETHGIYAEYLLQADGATKLWAVRCGGMVLSKSGEFCLDTTNSSRTKNYYKRFRFSTLKEAVRAARVAIRRDKKRKEEHMKMQGLIEEGTSGCMEKGGVNMM